MSRTLSTIHKMLHEKFPVKQFVMEPKPRTVNPFAKVVDEYKAAASVVVADSFQKANQVTEDLVLIQKQEFQKRFQAFIRQRRTVSTETLNRLPTVRIPTPSVV